MKTKVKHSRAAYESPICHPADMLLEGIICESDFGNEVYGATDSYENDELGDGMVNKGWY